MLARQAGRRAASVKFTCQKKNKKMYTWPVQRQHENIVVMRPGNRDASICISLTTIPPFFCCCCFSMTKESAEYRHLSLFIPTLSTASFYSHPTRVDSDVHAPACTFCTCCLDLSCTAKKSKTPQNKQEFPLNRVSTNFDQHQPLTIQSLRKTRNAQPTVS